MLPRCQRAGRGRSGTSTHLESRRSGSTYRASCWASTHQEPAPAPTEVGNKLDADVHCRSHPWGGRSGELLDPQHLKWQAETPRRALRLCALQGRSEDGCPGDAVVPASASAAPPYTWLCSPLPQQVSVQQSCPTKRAWLLTLASAVSPYTQSFRQICCIGLKPATLCTVVCLNLKKNPRRLHNLMEETSHSPSLTVPGYSA